MLLSQHPTHLGEADHPSYRRGVTPQPRREIPAAVQAALWALSNGHCYAPGCPFPVVYEVRPGVFKKNAQIAHIHAVKPNAPRYRPCTTDEERQQRDAFTNLILVCLATTPPSTTRRMANASTRLRPCANGSASTKANTGQPSPDWLR